MWKKRAGGVGEESEWGGKEEWFGWKRKMGKVGEERGLGRKRKYHPSLCARVIL